MNRFTYPVTLIPDVADGGFTVSFLDVPDAITQGDTVDECLIEAAHCLDEAMAGRIRRDDELPAPSECKKGEKPVPVPMQTAMKESGISKSELARKMSTQENVVHRILDPHHVTKFLTMERALLTLGKYAELHVT